MKFTLAVLAAALYLPSIAQGQTPAVAPGARIRVTAPARALERYVTTILEVRGDSIVIGTPGDSHAVELAHITALDISTGTGTQAAKGAVMGLAIGAVTGAVIGAVRYKECIPQEFLDCLLASDSRASEAIAGGAVLGGVGLVIGVVAGALNRTDRWESVDLPVQFAVIPMRSGGLGVALRRSF